MEIQKSLNLKLLGCFILFILMSGCNKDIHDHPHLTTGKALFEYHCVSCHQNSGMGKFLNGVPPNKGTHLSFHQIVHKIKTGEGAPRNMPVFATMSEEEASKITAYVKSL